MKNVATLCNGSGVNVPDVHERVQCLVCIE